MKWKKLWRRLRGGQLTRRRAAGSVAAGLFIGSLPLFGLHFPLCVAVCVPLSLDLVTAYVAANISNPVFAPFLVAAEVQVGALILEGHFVPFSIEQARSTGVTGFVLQAAVGALALGTTLALVGAAVTAAVVRRDPPVRDDSLDHAIDRTLLRYRRAPRGDRIYVATKLHTRSGSATAGATRAAVGRAARRGVRTWPAVHPARGSSGSRRAPPGSIGTNAKSECSRLQRATLVPPASPTRPELSFLLPTRC